MTSYIFALLPKLLLLCKVIKSGYGPNDQNRNKNSSSCLFKKERKKKKTELVLNGDANSQKDFANTFVPRMLNSVKCGLQGDRYHRRKNQDDDYGIAKGFKEQSHETFVFHLR
jgi:hypothetical protein